MIARLSAAGLAAGLFLAAPSVAAPLDMPRGGDVPAAPALERPLLGDRALGEDLERLSAAAEAEPAPDSVLESLAARLTTPEAAFAFVRDEIALESYGGALRGAESTLLARAGNAVDRSLLLAALLQAQEVNVRFAFAGLDDAAVARLYQRVMSRRPVMEAAPSPFIEALHARAAASFVALEAAALPSLEQTIDAGAMTARAQADLAAHVWVEGEIEGSWTAFDTAPGDLAPGETLAAAERTEAAIGDELHQWVTVRLIADHAGPDGLAESVWLEHRMTAIDAAAFPVMLVFADPAGAAPGGGAWGQASGAERRVPVLLIRDTGVRGESFDLVAAGGEGGGAIDALGGLDAAPAETVLTGLTLALEFETPGDSPIVTRRMVFDRAGPARMAALRGEAFELDRSEAAEAAARDGLRAATYGHHAIHVYSGAPNITSWLRALDETSRAAALALIEADLEGDAPMVADIEEARLQQAAMWRALPVTSDTLIVAAANRQSELRAYADRPRAMIVSHELDIAARALVTTIDWAQDRLRFVPGEGAGAAEIARAQLWFGAMQGALEAEFGLAVMHAAPVEPGDLSLTATSLGALRLVEREEGQAGGLSRARALEMDMMVLAGVDGDPRLYWEIEPATGATRAMAEPGAGAKQMVRTISGAIDGDTVWRIFEDGRSMRERDFQEARKAQAKLRAHHRAFKSKAEADAFYKKHWGRASRGAMEYQTTLEIAIDNSLLVAGLYGTFVGGGMLLGTFAVLEGLQGRDWSEPLRR